MGFPSAHDRRVALPGGTEAEDSGIVKGSEMRKPRLMTPGPAMVPEDVLLELARPVIHHRSAEAKQVIAEVAAGPEGGPPDARTT